MVDLVAYSSDGTWTHLPICDCGTGEFDVDHIINDFELKKFVGGITELHLLYIDCNLWSYNCDLYLHDNNLWYTCNFLFFCV